MTFNILTLKIIVILMILTGAVSSERHGNNQNNPNSKSVRKVVQKVAAVFFGCPALTPAIANVTCTNRIEKITKGVDCALKVPLGTRAKFTCPATHTMKENYDTIRCRFPGKWNNSAVNCIPSDGSHTGDLTNGTDGNTAASAATANTTNATDAAAAAAAAAATAAAATAATTAAAGAATTAVATVTTTTKPAITTTQKLLLPSQKMFFPTVGTVSLYKDEVIQPVAMSNCNAHNASLFTIVTPAEVSAATSMAGMGMLMPSTLLWTDPVYDAPAATFQNHLGVPFTGVWCPGSPSDPVNNLCSVVQNGAFCHVSIPCTDKHIFFCQGP